MGAERKARRGMRSGARIYDGSGGEAEAKAEGERETKIIA